MNIWNALSCFKYKHYWFICVMSGQEFTYGTVNQKRITVLQLKDVTYSTIMSIKVFIIVGVHVPIRHLTSLRCPHVAAACRGVHFSLSSALTLAPYSRRSWSMASLSSIQHWCSAVRPSSLHESGLTPRINKRLTEKKKRFINLRAVYFN